MTKYEELISSLKQIDTAKAEYLEEEIDIIIHKLKFLTEESLPKAIIVDQNRDFQPMDSEILAEKINIAGGRFISSLDQNPDCIVILQRSENLYGQLSELLNNIEIINTSAFQNNNLFIIQEASFNQSDDNYLKDTEILAEIFQPKYFFYGHDGSAWVKFEIQ
ncbi:MAG: ABC transporter substrate-binding protein [Sphingobacterium composti]